MTEEYTTEIRLELTEKTPLDDLIKFAELAKRYGYREQTGIVESSVANRERAVLVFQPMPGRIEPQAAADPKPAKRIDRVEYVEPEDRVNNSDRLSKLHTNRADSRSYYHGGNA